MLHVKWDRQLLHFPLPPLDTPLGTLRADLAAYTHLPVGSFKLVYKGAVMKEDTAKLSAYKIKENATIALIGGGHAISSSASSSKPSPSPAPAHKAVLPQTEESTIKAIKAELVRVRETLVPDVDAFVGALASASSLGPSVGAGAGDATTTTTTTTPTPPTTTTTEPCHGPSPLDHTRLSELLLQSLLRLDALHVSGVDWPDARVQRKAAVREVQGVLDRLDGAWARAR